MKNGITNLSNLCERIDLIIEKLAEIEAMQNCYANNQTKSSEKASVLRIDDVSKLLSRTRHTIYKLVQNKEIPYMKKGKCLYFFEDEILEWVKSGKRSTKNEISNLSNKSIYGRNNFSA